MWTLPDNFKDEWTPRGRVRTEPEEVDLDEDECPIGVRDGKLTPLAHVVLEALLPYGEAHQAVADALSCYLPPKRDGST